MKARQIQAEVVEAVSAAALETALNAWFQAAEERTFVEWKFQMIAGTYTVVILYSE